MDNGKLTYPIEDKVNETDEFEKFKQMIDAVNDKEAELRDLQSKMSLSDYSTTQLKAELRRRKKERRY